MAKKNPDFNQFVAALQKPHTEEDVKNCYARHFDIAYNTADRHNLYTPQAFFEFKFDKNFDNLKARAAILAQTLYYIHRFKYGITDKPLPATLVLADRNEAVLTNTILWKEFYTDTAERYDWDLAASNPDTQLVSDLTATDALPFCYFSTLYKEDVEHCHRLFPNAADVFQYDYLNDDIGNIFTEGQLPFGLTWKLPEKILAELQNPKIKWIILINPPFATSQTAGTSGDSKKDVSDTKLRKLMHAQNLGEVSRELFAQFLFRIKQEFKGKTAHLGLFSKLKYINANNDQKFRDTVFQFQFECGFMFSSVNFAGTSKSSQFPVGFLVWNLNKLQKIEDQSIVLDVFDTNVEKIGHKQLLVEHRDTFLSKWINRPAGVKKFPPFGSSINVKRDNADARDRISEHFLASLMCFGNDPQHQNFTALLSGPYVSAGSHSITPDIFEQGLVVHAVRRIPKADWQNDRDQFMQPKAELTQEFINDCAVWSLYSNSNETVAMRNVEYLKQRYQIDNHFFPFLKSEVKKWKITDSDIASSLAVGDERFVAKWLAQQTFSEESKAVLEAGTKIWQFYFEHLHELRTTKFKIETWDAGWWQIRNALADQDLAADLFTALKTAQDALKAKLLPQIYQYKFLS
ncbi:MAG: hypothetical protein ACKVT2_19030 [Saprospiraceae bacterium]